jgi:hypothetical protein
MSSIRSPLDLTQGVNLLRNFAALERARLSQESTTPRLFEESLSNPRVARFSCILEE